MRVTWNAINALLQSDWSAQHSGLGHENLSRVPRRIFPCGFPRPLVIRACVHVGKIRLARETKSYSYQWNRTGTEPEPNRNRTSFSRQQAYKRGHSSPVPSALPSSKKRGKSVVDVVNQHRIFLWISRGKREQQTWRLALKSACSPTPSRDVSSSTDKTFTSKNIAKALDESFVLLSRTDVHQRRQKSLFVSQCTAV